jgi:phosphoribosylamine---glycine ligase
VPLGPLLLAAAEGRLAEAAAAAGIRGPLVPARAEAVVAIVLAAAGYPGTPRRGDPIGGLAEAAAAGALVFHAGTARAANGRWTTAGGRVLAVVARGPDLPAARVAAERAADTVRWDGLQRRHDIAAVLPVPGGPASTPLAAASSGTGGRS